MQKIKPIFEKTSEKLEDQNNFWSNLEISNNDNHVLHGNSAKFFFECKDDRSKELFEILKANGLEEGDSVLEIGSNCGRNINYIKKMGIPNVIGIEINKKAIEYGIENYDALSEDNFIEGSVDIVIDKIKNVDWVFTMAVLVHLNKEQKESIYNWARENVNKGIVFVESFGNEDKAHHFSQNGHWYSVVKTDEVMDLGRSVNFGKIKSIGYTACIIKK